MKIDNRPFRYKNDPIYREKVLALNKKTYKKHRTKYLKEYKEKYRLNPEKYRNRSNSFRKKYPEKVKEIQLQIKYGIDIHIYKKMLTKQKHRCKICSKKRKTTEKAFAVDHCHKTNKVRGLLCQMCNTGLGNFKDNIKFLKSAIKYLKET